MSDIAPVASTGPFAALYLLQRCSLIRCCPCLQAAKHLRDMALGVHTINLNHPLSTESVSVPHLCQSLWRLMLHPALLSAVLICCSAP